MNNYTVRQAHCREQQGHMTGHAPLPNGGTAALLPDSPPPYSSGTDALLPPASMPSRQASNPNEGAGIRLHRELLLPQRGRP
jgi:hypothetical protein